MWSLCADPHLRISMSCSVLSHSVCLEDAGCFCPCIAKPAFRAAERTCQKDKKTMTTKCCSTTQQSSIKDSFYIGINKASCYFLPSLKKKLLIKSIASAISPIILLFCLRPVCPPVSRSFHLSVGPSFRRSICQYGCWRFG